MTRKIKGVGEVEDNGILNWKREGEKKIKLVSYNIKQ